jgi:group I intron endonuclease
MKFGSIYKLICPISHEVRYIGQTSNSLEKRLSEHIRKTISKIKHNKKLTHKENWIKSLIEKDLVNFLIIEQIEFCDLETLGDREFFWINEYKKSSKLTNLADGGFQPRGYKFNHTEESKKKISDGLINSEYFQKSVRSKSRGEKISKSNMGRIVSNKTRLKLSNALKNKFCGENNPFFGKNHSDESKKIMSQCASERVGEKNSFYNKKHTEETKEKIRIKLLEKPMKEYYIYDDEMNFIIKGSSIELLSFFRVKLPNEISRHCDKEKKYKGYYIKSN